MDFKSIVSSLTLHSNSELILIFPQQTGISEVFLEVSEKDMEKERMRKFVEAVEASGLNLSEGAPYKQGHNSIEKEILAWVLT